MSFIKILNKKRLRVVALVVILAGSIILQSVFVSDLSVHIANDCVGSALQQDDITKTTLDPNIQKIAKDDLARNMQKNNAASGSVIVIDANSGAIHGLVGLSSNNRQLVDEVANCNFFGKNGVLTPWEPGSVMKPLIIGAALDKKTVSMNTTYYETGQTPVDGFAITNAENLPPQTVNLQDVITRSLNTGAVFVLRTLGGGKINQQARDQYYDYLTNHYRFGEVTNLGLKDENAGYVRKPNSGPGIELRYAYMSFGIGLTVTPIQLASAYVSLVNGGTYYQPYLAAGQKPKVIGPRVVSTSTSATIRTLIQVSQQVNNPVIERKGYIIGAKSGTAPSPDLGGTYKIDLSNGTYVGFVGKDKPRYVILVRLIEPHVNGLASAEARLAWTKITDDLIDNNYIE